MKYLKHLLEYKLRKQREEFIKTRDNYAQEVSLYLNALVKELIQSDDLVQLQYGLVGDFDYHQWKPQCLTYTDHILPENLNIYNLLGDLSKQAKEENKYRRPLIIVSYNYNNEVELFTAELFIELIDGEINWDIDEEVV